ncbi:hypothetical protein YPH_4362 [Yersinia pestis biovar Orientalis str. PEXU2]|nr:hypothetical protein YPH_4362 [Yersinia pestis biovar Orientalis str. PEXU2]EEO90381.1 hypothetical protein YPS_2384 [Yersinia pestis Pestoides A]
MFVIFAEYRNIPLFVDDTIYVYPWIAIIEGDQLTT